MGRVLNVWLICFILTLQNLQGNNNIVYCILYVSKEVWGDSFVISLAEHFHWNISWLLDDTCLYHKVALYTILVLRTVFKKGFGQTLLTNCLSVSFIRQHSSNNIQEIYKPNFTSKLFFICLPVIFIYVCVYVYVYICLCICIYMCVCVCVILCLISFSLCLVFCFNRNIKKASDMLG